MMLPYVPAEKVFAHVAFRFMMPEAQIRGKSRKRHFMRARAAAVWLLKRTAGEHNQHLRSYPLIGRMLSGHDHSTVIHAERQCIAWMKQDLAYRLAVEGIADDLANGRELPIPDPETVEEPEKVAKKPEPLPVIKPRLRAKPRPRNDFTESEDFRERARLARLGSDRLLAAIALHHPERIAA